METEQSFTIIVHKHSSYRTYEEWKPLCIDYHIYQFFSSYRTYEEWKPSSAMMLRPSRELRSYRTYEEWKLPSVGYRKRRSRVLTVPMRNGNIVK